MSFHQWTWLIDFITPQCYNLSAAFASAAFALGSLVSNHIDYTWNVYFLAWTNLSVHFKQIAAANAKNAFCKNTFCPTHKNVATYCLNVWSSCDVCTRNLHPPRQDSWASNYDGRITPQESKSVNLKSAHVALQLQLMFLTAWAYVAIFIDFIKRP